MARIRSIKPDFFKSETVATLPLSARLTFIGLWTHVDDNGVTIDNAKLITAAIWPLEDDPTETLKRTQEDLMSLSEAGLIVRYEVHGKRFMFIRSWFEHQKVPHPSKPRYPLPADVTRTAPKWAVSSGNADSDPRVSMSSRNPHEDIANPPDVLTPEKGTGNREQGIKTCPPPTASDVSMSSGDGPSDPPKPKRTSRSKKPEPLADDDPRFIEVWAAYPKKDKKIKAREALAVALADGTDPQVIVNRLKAFVEKLRRNQTELKYYPLLVTWLNGRQWEDEDDVEPRPAGTPRPKAVPLSEQCHIHYNQPAATCGGCEADRNLTRKRPAA